MKSSSPSLYDHAGYLVKKLQHALRGHMDKELRVIKLSTAQYAVLCALEETCGVSGAEIARRCFITPQSVNEIIVTLEKTKLITREASTTHGRIINIALSASGRSRLKSAHRIVTNIGNKMLEGLDREKQKEFSDMLRQCIDNLGRNP